jgi:hypothetical protein
MIQCPECSRQELNAFMLGAHLMEKHGWSKQRADERMLDSLTGPAARLRDLTKEMLRKRAAAAGQRQTKHVDAEVLPPEE